MLRGRGGGKRGVLRGGIAGQCCPLRYRALYGGIAAILSQIAVEWVTKSTLRNLFLQFDVNPWSSSSKSHYNALPVRT